MANSNFVVQHGLTVGPLTIDAATGSISTPGNVNITGNLGVSSISKNDSSININDTGGSSIIVMNIDGATEHTLTASRASFLSEVYAAGVTTVGGNLVANSATTSTNTTTGAVVVTGGIGVSGNVNIGGRATVATQGTTPTAITNKDYVDTQNIVYGVVFGY